mmetsp:Transcript_32195/g.125908  ORF Transcript_32195/g.125908 Transcript_32195/m.125908 type:complete len:129 (-) Transcript_32195:1551-1937(-)
MGVGFVLVTPPTGEHRGRRLVSGLNRRATVKVFTGAQTLAPLEKRVAEIEEESETVELSQRNLNVKAFAVGATAGLIGSMIGAGGGIVLTPLMTSVSRFLSRLKNVLLESTKTDAISFRWKVFKAVTT